MGRRACEAKLALGIEGETSDRNLLRLVEWNLVCPSVIELSRARRGAQEIGGDPILCASWPGGVKANLAQREKYGKSQPRWA